MVTRREHDRTGAAARRRVLLIEDSRPIAELLELHLEDLRCDVDWARDGTEGWQRAATGAYHLIILDLMLPGLDGMEICRRVRARPDYVPILMLTAKSSELDRVVGLEIGADDYLTKPFSLHELLARVKAIFRRVDALKSGESAPLSGSIRAGGVEIDIDRRAVVVQGRSVELTAKEFDLLVEFVRHPGIVFSRSRLLDRVWGRGYVGYEHTVNSYINRLRGKLEQDPRRPRYILTVWGVGYKFTSDAGP